MARDDEECGVTEPDDCHGGVLSSTAAGTAAASGRIDARVPRLRS